MDLMHLLAQVSRALSHTCVAREGVVHKVHKVHKVKYILYIRSYDDPPRGRKVVRKVHKGGRAWFLPGGPGELRPKGTAAKDNSLCTACPDASGRPAHAA